MKLIPEWRNAWRMLSVWAFALIGAAPDIHSAIVAMGWLNDPGVPASFVWLVRGLAVLGIAVRLMKQKAAKPE
jgi:hypothetical protein